LNLTPKEAERLKKVGDARRRARMGRAGVGSPSKGVDDGATRAAEVNKLEVEKETEFKKELGLEAAR
jgi:hypothetical protein